MIYVGIDDTDTLDTPGTNQLARALVARVADNYKCVLIVRHQLLFDPRVPYTSKNGSASILLEPRGLARLDEMIRELRAGMLDWFKAGSDPGLCATMSVPVDVTAFGMRCQREIVHQEVARQIAAACGVYLEGLGGTEGGVIGALAAVGLLATGNDGRIVNLGTWPDDLSGSQDVDVGKHLRPNYRDGRAVVFVVADSTFWRAVRFT
jgi:tRNA(Ile2) C34 agmatinyltransferase TiaS